MNENNNLHCYNIIIKKPPLILTIIKDALSFLMIFLEHWTTMCRLLYERDLTIDYRYRNGMYRYRYCGILWN